LRTSQKQEAALELRILGIGYGRRLMCSYLLGAKFDGNLDNFLLVVSDALISTRFLRTCGVPYCSVHIADGLGNFANELIVGLVVIHSEQDMMRMFELVTESLVSLDLE